MDVVSRHESAFKKGTVIALRVSTPGFCEKPSRKEQIKYGRSPSQRQRPPQVNRGSIYPPAQEFSRNPRAVISNLGWAQSPFARINPVLWGLIGDRIRQGTSVPLSMRPSHFIRCRSSCRHGKSFPRLPRLGSTVWPPSKSRGSRRSFLRFFPRSTPSLPREGTLPDVRQPARLSKAGGFSRLHQSTGSINWDFSQPIQLRFRS